MTSPVLRVSPVSLRTLAQRCQTLAGQLAPPLPPVSASPWQTSGAAATTINTSSTHAAAAMRGRMTASAAKLTAAAHEYEAMDNDGAAALAAVPQRAASYTQLVPRGSGGDGGAGGIVIPS